MLKKEGEVQINRKVAAFQTLLQTGDEVWIDLGVEKSDGVAVPMPLKVLYEDFDLLVVNKPPQLVTHPTRSHQTDTLANAIYHHWQEKKSHAKYALSID